MYILQVVAYSEILFRHLARFTDNNKELLNSGPLNTKHRRYTLDCYVLHTI